MCVQKDACNVANACAGVASLCSFSFNSTLVPSPSILSIRLLLSLLAFVAIINIALNGL